MSNIEGIPEGWELVRVGKPIINVDCVVAEDGMPVLIDWVTDRRNWLIIRKIEKPKTYRPFANAAEFEPHRDRWVKRKHKHDIEDGLSAGCFSVSSYGNDGVWTIDGKAISYRQMFADGKTFDDGSPFGVEVTE